MPRRTPITLKGQIGALVAKGDVGRHSLILDDSDIRLLLRAAIEQEGNISAFAKRHGLERTNLTNVLNGKRPVSSSIAKALGLRKVYVPQ
jgi:DNA-binding phage protein